MDGLVGYAIAPSFSESQLARPPYSGVVLLFLELGIGFLSGFSSFHFIKTQNASMAVQLFLMFLALPSTWHNTFVGSPGLERASNSI